MIPTFCNDARINYNTQDEECYTMLLSYGAERIAHIKLSPQAVKVLFNDMEKIRKDGGFR